MTSPASPGAPRQDPDAFRVEIKPNGARIVHSPNGDPFELDLVDENSATCRHCLYLEPDCRFAHVHHLYTSPRPKN